MNKERKAEIFLILLSIMMAIPVLVYARKSVPVLDDYANAYSLLKNYGWGDSFFSTVIASAKRTSYLYKTTSGYFFAAFLNFLCSPFLRGGIHALRVFNLVIYICFFCSLYFLIYTFSKRILGINKQYASLGVYFLVLMQIINGYNNSEIYTWYCCVVAYVFPVLLLFVSLSLLILAMTGKYWLYIPSAIFSFLISGSSLNISALNCGLTFIACVYAFIRFREKRGNVFVFASGLVGALINVLSPGNYVRHDAETSNYDIFQSLYDTFVASFGSIELRISKTPFMIILIILLIVILMHSDDKSRELKYKHPFLSILMIFAGVIIVNFPFCFGYSTDQLSDRVVFIQDIALYLLSIIWISYFAGWLKKRFTSIVVSQNLLFCIVINLVMSLMIIISIHGGLCSFTTGDMISSLLNGDFIKCVEYEEDIINEVAESKDNDVVIARNSKVELRSYKSVGLSDNTESLANECIADFYGKDSVRLIISDE